MFTFCVQKVDNKAWNKKDAKELVVPVPPGESEVDGGQDGNVAHFEAKKSSTGKAAILKKGVLGNFEPPEPPKTFKPGRNTSIFSSLIAKPDKNINLIFTVELVKIRNYCVLVWFFSL
jgi:hypothetical protein